MEFKDVFKELRLKKELKQGDIAAVLGIDRSTIGKWEQGINKPTIDVLLVIADFYDVTTDYLLKDEMEEIQPVSANDGASAGYRDEPAEPVRKVSMQQANEFLAAKERTAGKVALATFLCIVSPVMMIFMAGGADAGVFRFNEDKAGVAGLIIMFIMVAFAVAIFISCGGMTKQFDFLETENIETEYGVTGMVKERKAAYKETYTRNNVIGTCFAILSVVPLFGAFLISESDFAAIVGVCLLFIIVGIGVVFFINGGIRWASYEKLLEEGEYTRRSKAGKRGILGALSGAYWILITAVYLAVSLPNDNWDETWVIWPVAGLIFAAWRGIAAAVVNRKNS